MIIGTVGALTGPSSAATIDGIRAVAAWVLDVDSKAGLDCHPVSYIARDDGNDPAKNLGVTKQMVEHDHAIALVHSTSPAGGQASVGYLTAKRVPVIGSEGMSPWFYTSPMHFPQATSAEGLSDILGATMGAVARAQGKTRLTTMACIESPVCKDFGDRVPALAQKYGLNPVFQVRSSVNQPDYAGECANAGRVNAEVYAIFMDAGGMVRAARNCGPKPYATLIHVAPIPPSEANLAGMTAGSSLMPWMVTANAGVAAFLAAMQKHAASVKPGPSSLAGWVSAKLFELAAARLGETPTSQNILDGLWAIKNNDLAGLTAPRTFSKDKAAPRTPICYWLLKVKDAQYTSEDNGQRRCL